MDAAEDEVEGTVAGDQVLDVAGVGGVEVEVGLPGRGAVPAHGLQEGHEALVGQVPHLAVEAAEVGGVHPVEVGEAVAVREHLEGTIAVLVGHVLGRGEGPVGGGDPRVRRPVAELLPGVAQVDAVRVRERGAVVIGLPVGERGDEADGVEALSLPVRDGLLEADAGRRARSPARPGTPRNGSRQVEAASHVSPTRKNGVPSACCSALPFAVARTKPRRLAFSCFSASVHATARSRPRPPVQPGVVRLVRARPPAPLARRRRDEPHLERAPAVPEAVDAAGEAGPSSSIQHSTSM